METVLARHKDNQLACLSLPRLQETHPVVTTMTCPEARQSADFTDGIASELLRPKSPPGDGFPLCSRPPGA